MICDKLYDIDFVERWTNGPLLLRTDREWWLTEKDIINGGSEKRYLAWDKRSDGPIIWDPVMQQFYRLDGEPIPEGEVQVALEGHFEVPTYEGFTVECKTAFTVFKERIMEYTLERMAEITWVPEDLLEESARLYAETKPACIYRGVASDQLGRAASSVEIARAMLRILSGNLDRIGGDIMT